MRPLLYLTDLDKTFLRSDLSVSDTSREIWNRCVAEGGKLSIATARSLTGVRKLLKGLDLKEPMILLDGAVIATMEGELRHVAALDRETGEAVIETGRKVCGMEPLLVGMEANGMETFVYPRHPNPWQQELLKTMHNDRRILDAEPLQAMERNLKIVYMESEAKTMELEEALRRELGEAIEIKRSADPYIDCWFMTVLHPEGDKAHALARLEELEGVDRRHTTVFGDSHNDIGLFEMAGRKVAVANAIDELKERADIVLPWTNDEDAVARFLEGEAAFRYNQPKRNGGS
ncbi:HAD family hydrolase [Nitratifractor sp.]